jgi:glycosyltransferase involved in cell wall biosynthesis
MGLQCSVIIPVYNAAGYVRAAVESAIAQPETGEVILTEEASPDRSLDACQQLAAEYDRVRVLRHPDEKNHGTGASRNLGIRNARFDYISFLDADNYFLPERLSVAKTLFQEDSEIGGMYEAIGLEFEDGDSKARWLALREKNSLATMKERVRPEEPFEKQRPVGSSGFCQTGGWVVKTSVFDKTGLFDEHFQLNQTQSCSSSWLLSAR